MIRGNFAGRLGLVLLALVAASCATTPADAGRKGSGLGFRHSVQSFTPVIAASVTYDTAVGASVDTTGVASLPLRVGAHRYFVNSSTGSDSNNCTAAQTASTPKATIGGGFSCVTDNASAGDQVLVAEGTSYTEDLGTQTATYPVANGGTWLAYKGGFSVTYPTVLQSYDPADPTNEAKYGRGVYRSNPPQLTGDQTQNSNGTWAYFAMRGLKFAHSTTATDYRSFTLFGHASYLLLEGNYFQNTQLDIEAGVDSTAGPYFTYDHVIVRNNVFDTPWDYKTVSDPTHATGRIGAFFIDGFNHVTWEDNFVYHNGWGPTQTRSTILTQQTQTHPIYLSPDCPNFIGRRNLVIDPSSDGGSLRGDGIFTENVVIGAPIGLALGPPSTEIIWRTDGVPVRASYNLIMAGVQFDSGASLGDIGSGFNSDTGREGSEIDHNLIIRKAAGMSRQGVEFSNIAWGSTSYRSYMEHHHNISYDWNDPGYSFYSAGGPAPTYALPYTTYDYNQWGDSPSGTNTTSSTFVNAYTEAALYVAAGYADKAAIVSAMLGNPSLHIGRALRTLAFAGYGMPLDDAHKSDQTAPTLSAATASSPSAGNATIGATTTENNGKLYYELLTTATQPAKAQVKMGVDGSHAAGTSPGALTIASIGVKSVNLSGVPPGTYYAHLVHEDAAGNKSNIVTSSSFAVVGLTAIWNGSTDTPASGAVWTRSNGNLTATRTTNDDTIAQLFASQAKASGTVIVTVTAKGTGSPSLFGGAYSALPFSIGIDPGNETSVVGSSHGIGYRNDGTVLFEGATKATGLATLGTGNVLKIVKDATNLKFYVDNVLQYTFTGSDYNFSDVHGAAYPAATSIGSHDTALTIDASGW